jgi:hypothetical protein
MFSKTEIFTIFLALIMLGVCMGLLGFNIKSKMSFCERYFPSVNNFECVINDRYTLGGKR